jgi:YD repeat-containing protein
VKEKIIGLPTINNTLINYSNHKVKVYFNGMELPIASIKRSIIIDGWQKVDIEYTIPQYQTGELLFKFIKLNSTASSIYFDDIRVHPFNSSMKTYVYHPDNLRLVAELDENNFATIYEYDEEGALTRIKKETERGIFTLQESRNNKAKDKSIYDLDPSTNIQN